MFAQPDLDYPAQMTAHAEQRQARRTHRQPTQPALSVERAAWLSKAEELRAQRRRHRQALQASQRAWRQLRQTRQQQQAEHAAQEARWRQDRQRHQAESAAREAADLAWRQTRQALLDAEAQAQATLPPVLSWIAILVMIDNCTRRCLGLVSFAAGVHVTAESVVAALRQFLPTGLKSVISDNGSQFRSDAFAGLASAAQFIPVRIAPHRARTNGIAERFVRTLKEDLEECTWSGPDDMLDILAQVRAAYDERPHQGHELQGLSPNEYDRRLRLSASC